MWRLIIVATRNIYVEMVFMAGILAPGNRRPTKITARKTREVKAAIPRKQPKVEELPICGDEPPMRDKVKVQSWSAYSSSLHNVQVFPQIAKATRNLNPNPSKFDCRNVSTNS